MTRDDQHHIELLSLFPWKPLHGLTWDGVTFLAGAPDTGVPGTVATGDYTAYPVGMNVRDALAFLYKVNNFHCSYSAHVGDFPSTTDYSWGTIVTDILNIRIEDKPFDLKPVAIKEKQLLQGGATTLTHIALSHSVAIKSVVFSSEDGSRGPDMQSGSPPAWRTGDGDAGGNFGVSCYFPSSCTVDLGEFGIFYGGSSPATGFDHAGAGDTPQNAYNDDGSLVAWDHGWRNPDGSVAYGVHANGTAGSFFEALNADMGAFSGVNIDIVWNNGPWAYNPQTGAWYPPVTVTFSIASSPSGSQSDPRGNSWTSVAPGTFEGYIKGDVFAISDQTGGGTFGLAVLLLRKDTGATGNTLTVQECRGDTLWPYSP